jgi:BRO family protein
VLGLLGIIRVMSENDTPPDDSQNKLVVFGGKQIRRAWVDDQWFFSVVDIVGVLTDSDNPRDYWYRMKRREKESSGVELSTLCRQLKLTSSDGKSYETDTVNTESAFRIIQSIPSPKAEPFKRWLAQVGYQRVQEIENPELAQQRMRELYKAKGYPDDWIEKRVRSIAVRDELTREWKNRGVPKALTSTIPLDSSIKRIIRKSSRIPRAVLRKLCRLSGLASCSVMYSSTGLLSWPWPVPATEARTIAGPNTPSSLAFRRLSTRPARHCMALASLPRSAI